MMVINGEVLLKSCKNGGGAGWMKALMRMESETGSDEA